MKKFSIFMMLIFAMTSLLFVGCGKKDDENTIRLSEVTHSIFYAPLYAAMNLGYFEDEGLTIELTNAGGSDLAMTALLTDTADIALLGPETAVSVAAQGRDDLPKIFGQLTKKDGSFLISKTDQPDFDWSNLGDSHIIAGRQGGSPAMSLQKALENNGYDIENDLNFDLSVSFNNIVSAFTASSDTNIYMTAFEPTASSIVREGKGYIVDSVGSESGSIPFTVFMANESYLKEHPEIAEDFLAAVMKGYTYIMTESMENIVKALKPSFDTFTDEDIEDSITNYKNIDAWSESPVMSLDSFNNLQNMMINSSVLDESDKQNYADIVDNTIAHKVMSAL